jgi:hypothetical protein
MRLRTRVLLGIPVTAALLSACAATAPKSAMLTYESVPDGAEIFEGGKSLGAVPVTRTYQSDGKSSAIHTPDVRAVWPSGAQTTFFTLLPVGSDRIATLERPADAPGRQQDLEHAKQVADARKRDAARNRGFQQTDINRASALCKREQARGSNGLSDDCK